MAFPPDTCMLILLLLEQRSHISRSFCDIVSAYDHCFNTGWLLHCNGTFQVDLAIAALIEVGFWGILMWSFLNFLNAGLMTWSLSSAQAVKTPVSFLSQDRRQLCMWFRDDSLLVKGMSQDFPAFFFLCWDMFYHVFNIFHFYICITSLLARALNPWAFDAQIGLRTMFKKRERPKAFESSASYVVLCSLRQLHVYLAGYKHEYIVNIIL